jgi:PmbA protein
MFTEKEAKKVCEDVLRRCKDGAAEVIVSFDDSSLTRFANNTIHQNVAERDADVLVRFVIGKQIGTASSNRIDPEGLDELVAQARFNAQASPEDPTYPGLSQPAEYAHVTAFDPATAQYTPEARAKAVGLVCRLAAEKGLNAFGAFSTGAAHVAIANSQGVFAYHSMTRADFQTVVMSQDSSGRAQGSGWNTAQFDPETLGRQAVAKAEMGHDPRLAEAGEYTVVLEHYATQDILQMLNFTGMGAQSLIEGRSWMTDRIDQPVMSGSVSIWDDALDPAGAPMPFDFEGVPKQRVDIVKDGVVKGPVYDRYSGAKSGKSSTGHALPPTARGFGPIAMNLFMATGDATLDEMVRSTEKGLYISRFWYTRPVHPRDCVITGMTRDGVFVIENGEIAYPVKNLRFTQSYVQALANVAAIGQQSHLLVGDFGGFAMRVPALKIDRFNFTGTTA